MMKILKLLFSVVLFSATVGVAALQFNRLLDVFEAE
jgi:hypothetical protein